MTLEKRLEGGEGTGNMDSAGGGLQEDGATYAKALQQKQRLC